MYVFCVYFAVFNNFRHTNNISLSRFIWLKTAMPVIVKSFHDFNVWKTLFYILFCYSLAPLPTDKCFWHIFRLAVSYIILHPIVVCRTRTLYNNMRYTTRFRNLLKKKKPLGLFFFIFFVCLFFLRPRCIMSSAYELRTRW